MGIEGSLQLRHFCILLLQFKIIGFFYAFIEPGTHGVDVLGDFRETALPEISGKLVFQVVVGKNIQPLFYDGHFFRYLPLDAAADKNGETKKGHEDGKKQRGVLVHGPEHI